MTGTNTPLPQEVERVARAICAAEGFDWDAQSSFMTSASGGENEQEHYLHLARAALSAMHGWQDIATAPKNGKPIWAILHADLSTRAGRPGLESWDGAQGSFRHPGIDDRGFDCGWHIAAPVGHGGFPDDWIAGWRPLPAPPQATDPAQIPQGE